MYTVDIENKGEYKFSAKANNFEINIDSKGSAMSPMDVLLASLGSCIGVYIRKYFEGARLPLEGFSVHLEAEFTKEPPIRFQHISALVKLRGQGLDEKRKKSLLDFIKNCPVHNTIKNNPDIDISLL